MPRPMSSEPTPVFTSPRVQAVMTTRSGGVSRPPYESLNLGLHVGDDAAAVAHNRSLLAHRMGMPTVRLVQVHGCMVVPIDRASLDGPAPTADAAVCTEPGVACEIQVADCLPVLLADGGGRIVGAAHAGWRGLAGGVLEATIDAMVCRAGVEPADLQAWLGPCIGPSRFEVGDDVRQAFESSQPDAGRWFGPGLPGKWWADLPALARARLERAGLTRIAGNDGSPGWCTVTQPSAFFSFRRDGVTGRMAAAIGLRSLG